MLMAGAVLSLVLAVVPAVRAQTPDKDTPAEETVCDDAGLTGAAWGLCNAYCEAMDCDSEDPNASLAACQNVLSKYATHTEQRIPCARIPCPCFAPEGVDALLLMCENRGLSVTCWDVILMGQGPIFWTEMECNNPSTQVDHYLRARIDARIFVHASCATVNVRPLPNKLRGITVDQAEACQQVLRDRIGDDVCDSVIISP